MANSLKNLVTPETRNGRWCEPKAGRITIRHRQVMMTLHRKDLDQFTGSEVFYRHAFLRAIVYTEGVRFPAENGHAYWLINAIASHLLSQEFHQAAAKDSRLKLIHFWNLAVHPDRQADLTARADDGEEPFVTQHLKYTIFRSMKLTSGRRTTATAIR